MKSMNVAKFCIHRMMISVSTMFFSFNKSAYYVLNSMRHAFYVLLHEHLRSRALQLLNLVQTMERSVKFCL